MRTLINDLEENKISTISGYASKIRNTKYMIFVMLHDRSGKIQVSIDKGTQEALAKELEDVLKDSIIEFSGKMVKSEYVKDGGKEFLPESVKILSKAEPSPLEENANLDTKLDYRFIDLRTEKNNLLFKVQTELTRAMREFLLKKEFVEIHTPKLIGAASESGSSVFEVNYFNTKAYLAQSPQFYKQMALASNFERVFEVAPAFRAENSNTYRHTTEFTSFDLEFAYIDSYEDVMDMEEDLLITGLSAIKEKYGEKIKELFDIDVVVPKKPFPRIKLNDLYQELNKRYGYNIPEEDVGDMNTETESLASKYAMEEYGHEFLFITDFSKTKRAFYHMRKDDVPQGYDLIYRGTEITTGAQREHRYDVLKAQCEEKGLMGDDIKFYLEFFKYGCPPHGGFAIGLDRLTMLILGTKSLKETMFLFRGPNRLTP